MYLSCNGGRQGTAEHKGGFKGLSKWRKLTWVCGLCERETRLWSLILTSKNSPTLKQTLSAKRNRPHRISGWSMHILHDQGAECDSALQCFYSSKQPPLILRGSHKTWIRCIRQIISSAIQDAKSSPVDDSCTVRSTHFIPFHTTAYELWHVGQTTAATHTHRHTDMHTRLGTNYYVIIIVIKNLI